MRKVTKEEAYLVHTAVKAEMAAFRKSKAKGIPMEVVFKEAGLEMKKHPTPTKLKKTAVHEK